HRSPHHLFSSTHTPTTELYTFPYTTLFRSKAVGIFAGFNEWQLGVAAVALVAVSWWLFRLSRQRRSVLLHPEALRLERANPAHRSEERRVGKECRARWGREQ